MFKRFGAMQFPQSPSLKPSTQSPSLKPSSQASTSHSSQSMPDMTSYSSQTKSPNSTASSACVGENVYRTCNHQNRNLLLQRFTITRHLSDPIGRTRCSGKRDATERIVPRFQWIHRRARAQSS